MINKLVLCSLFLIMFSFLNVEKSMAYTLVNEGGWTTTPERGERQWSLGVTTIRGYKRQFMGAPHNFASASTGTTWNQQYRFPIIFVMRGGDRQVTKDSDNLYLQNKYREFQSLWSTNDSIWSPKPQHSIDEYKR